MLEVAGLVKRYGDVLALDGCSLRVPAGHLMAPRTALADAQSGR